MRTHLAKHLWLLGTLGVASWATLANPGLGFSLLGGSLGVATSGSGYQRDVRAWINSLDASANNNTTPDPLFPGALGGAMAISKAAKGWASDTAAAAKNFDFDWQGETNVAGSVNDNVVSWVSSCGGGTLAFTQSPISDGWTIKVCDEWTWSDGPGNPGAGQIDLQGVVTHELGHALGLGHTNVNCNNCNDTATGAATMCPAICGSGVVQRLIAADDAAGLEAVYGAAPASKPRITGLGGGVLIGQTLVINGINFAPVVNVKFTAGTTQNTGTIPGVVFNVPSQNGGTQISVTIPAAAQKGNVLVWEPSLGLLSNAFPIDVGFVPPSPPQITNVSPQRVSAFGGGIITLTGSGFSNASQVSSGGTVLTPPFGFTVVNDNTITYSAPNAAALGLASVNVTVSGVGTSNNGTFTYVETVPPLLVASGISSGGLPVSYSFGGPASDPWFLLIAINDATTFPFGSDNILLNSQVYFSGVLDGVGLGSQGFVMPAGLGTFTFYSQLITFDGANVGVSNVTTTLNLL